MYTLYPGKSKKVIFNSIYILQRLGVAAACLACVAAAVDWQARQSCFVWCGGVN